MFPASLYFTRYSARSSLVMESHLRARDLYICQNFLEQQYRVTEVILILQFIVDFCKEEQDNAQAGNAEQDFVSSSV